MVKMYQISSALSPVAFVDDLTWVQPILLRLMNCSLDGHK